MVQKSFLTPKNTLMVLASVAVIGAIFTAVSATSRDQIIVSKASVPTPTPPAYLCSKCGYFDSSLIACSNSPCSVGKKCVAQKATCGSNVNCWRRDCSTPVESK
jgi:hypothetical protein